jgi:dUTP pyrophosphatase
MEKIKVKVKRLDKDLPLPEQAHSSDAGVDLYSRVNLTLKPGERALIPTGIALSIPVGFAGFVQPRSGLALRHGLSLVNTPGLIDPHYRGEIGVIMVNLDKNNSFEIKKGMKIAQLVFQRVAEPVWEEVQDLDATERGEKGFGSTGF